MDDMSDLYILNTIVKCIESNFDISNNENLEVLIKKYPEISQYKEFHTKISSKNNNDLNLDSLLFMNLLLCEFQNYLSKNQNNILEKYHFRLGAIGKISIRLIEITEENIALLRNGFGTSVISNLRLMLEAYAISKYLMESDDIESDRFQDFGIVQECHMYNKNTKELFEDKNYEDGFLNPKSDFAWVTNKKLKSPIDFIKLLNNQEILNWYKYFCKYVHSSPYSCGKVYQMNKKSKNNENAYFPFELKNLIQQNKYYIYLFMELVGVNFVVDEQTRDFYKSVAALIYNYKKEFYK